MNYSDIKIGVDVGGSHITAGLVNLETRSLIEGSLIRRSVNSAANCEFIIDEWAHTIKSLIGEKNKVVGVGIAMPGPFDYEKGISLMRNQGKYDSLYGLNIKQLLADSLNLKTNQITIKNDASCFLLGEVYSGSMVGFNNVIGITLGTGLGSAHYIGGKVKDANLWKMSFMGGIAEDYISTRWFVNRWKELTTLEVKGVKEIVTSKEHEIKINQLFEEFAKNLTEFIHLFFKKKHPCAVVLGGNIMNADHLFLKKVQKYLHDKMGISIPITKSIHGEVAALIGAASLFKY